MDQMLDIQIVRAITAIGPLTRPQIINRVNGNSADVEASLDALVTMGCLRTELNTFKQFEYRLKPNFSERDCKLSAHREKIASFVAKHGSDSKAILPVYNGIKFSEGLDRAIWKAANTGRWMMVREIRDILTNVGFRKGDVIKRLQHIIDEGIWFARQSGHRHNQFFRLRDNVECPDVPGARLRGETSSIAFLDDAGLFKQQPDPTIQPAVTAPQIAASSSITLQKEKEIMKAAYFPLSALGEKVLEEAIRHLLKFVREDGTLHEAIWAILSDDEEYSCADLVVVLSRIGFTEKQISPLLSKRYADGLLTRRLVQVGGKWVNVYKKAGELPAKFTTTESVVSDIIDAQATTEVKVIAPQQIASNTTQVVEKPELFSYALHIKGIKIGITEFQALYKELYEEGFVKEAHLSKPKTRVLQTTHEIKGVQFSREELIDLTNAMYYTATEFKRALAV
jgi:hypothetical protein